VVCEVEAVDELLSEDIPVAVNAVHYHGELVCRRNILTGSVKYV